MFYKTLINEIGLVPLGLLFIFLLDPFSLSLYIGYLIILFIILFRNKIIFKNLDAESLILLLFCLSYGAFDYLNGNDRGMQLLIVELFFPFFFYCFGKIAITGRFRQKHIFLFFLLCSIIFSISALATIVKDLMEGGFIQVNRDFSSIWDGREILATGMAGYLIYNVSLPIFVISKNKLLNIVERILLFIVFFITLICSFRLGSRTIIVLTVFSLVFGVLFQLRNMELREKFKFITLIIVLSIVIIYFVPFNPDADVFSTLGHRLKDGTSSNASAGGRTELWSSSFEKISKNPLGWDATKYGHNMWLDAAKVAGIIPLFFLIVFTIKSVINSIKIFRTKSLDISIRLSFGLFTLLSLIFFFGEPILEGNIFLFIFFCFQQGLLKKTIELRR